MTVTIFSFFHFSNDSSAERNSPTRKGFELTRKMFTGK